MATVDTRIAQVIPTITNIPDRKKDLPEQLAINATNSLIQQKNAIDIMNPLFEDLNTMMGEVNAVFDDIEGIVTATGSHATAAAISESTAAAHKDQTLVYRNEAEVFKDEAQGFKNSAELYFNDLYDLANTLTVGDVLRVSTFIASDGQTVFPVQHSSQNVILFYLNGMLLPQTEYSSTDNYNSVTLVDPAAAGQDIVICIFNRVELLNCLTEFDIGERIPSLESSKVSII